MDDFLLREAEHKERVALELEKSAEAAVLKEAARQRDAARELRTEWERRQPQQPAPGPAPAAPEEESPEIAALREYIVDSIKSCYDPEIPVNIYDLGLIYAIRIKDEGKVEVDMTLTAPGCPAAGVLPGEVEGKVRSVPGVSEVALNLVWEPPWEQSKMSEAARLQLGIDW
ncbi:MAG TPA: SUF system Fe-S cluster assembly protein [Terriglobales bacterium]|nr:SUF system Fe-S cluster assembly protein [Terriglobales bacterium]